MATSSRAAAVLALVLLPTVACAVELPVTGVTMLPNGAEVVRSGTLPDGDDWIAGLPEDIADADLAVQVEGVRDPQWRLAMPAPAPAAEPDRAAADARAHALRVAQAALARAELHQRLALALRASPEPAAGEPPESLPGPAAIAALRGFASQNAAAADQERAAAEAAIRAAQEGAPPPDAEDAGAAPASRSRALEVAHAGGHAVRVRYRIAKAGWHAAYRLEIQDGAATLVLLARCAQWDQAWPALPVTFSTHASGADVLLPPMSVPIIGVEDAVGGFTIPRRPPGNLERPVCQNALLARLASIQRDDGGFGSGRFLVATTALDALCFQRQGFDTAPSPYQAAIARALALLQRQDPDRLGLAELALAACALSEHAAATGADTDGAQRALDALVRRIASGAVDDALLRTGPLEGPMAYLLAAQALQAAATAGLRVGTGPDLLTQSLPRIARAGDRVLADLVARAAGACRGVDEPVPLALAQLWAESMPRWLARAQPERVYLAVLATSRSGGASSQTVRAAARACLGERIDIAGSFQVGDPAGAEIGNAYCLLAFGEVGGGESVRALADAVGADAPRSVASADAGSHGWPMRWTAPSAVQLQPGAITEVELARTAVRPVWTWSALPLLGDGVWRALRATNTSATALPEGDAEVVDDGRVVGMTNLPFTPPGQALEMPLGLEPGIKVQATPSVTSSEGMVTRTLSVHIHYELIAPASWTHVVGLIEPMPLPGARLDLHVPGLDDRLLAARRSVDPFFHRPLSVGLPADLDYTVTYPASQRPYLEYR